MQIETQTLKCPNCGAPLTTGPGAALVTCAYCGSRVRLIQDEQGARASLEIPVFVPQGPPTRLVRKLGVSGLFIFALVIVSIVGCIVAIGLLSQAIFRSSPTFDMAMQMAQSNPKVVAAFGKPLQPGFFFTGNISSSGKQGSANYQFPITGPLRGGELQVQGTLNQDGWRLDVWAVYQQNGEDVSIHMTRAP
jgi:DNA-directed RNA polymerase subunit RPC12/RpoP